MKINIGCGWECKEGWVNVDNTSKWQAKNYPITFMDATKPWPYDDNTFDYAISEHMIEHISEHKGLFMLKEAFRTLKLHGVIRIICPDREFSENLPGQDDLEYVQNYAKLIFKRKAIPGDAAKISNRTLRQQGHVWVPTGSQLKKQIEKAGFKNVKICKYGISEHNVLNNVDINDGIRCWESVCMEGIKC